MSWNRFQSGTFWQNKQYTNNANPQFLHPVKIEIINPELDKLVKTFCPVGAGKYRK
jgi:hypothetical protein